MELSAGNGNAPPPFRQNPPGTLDASLFKGRHTYHYGMHCRHMHNICISTSITVRFWFEQFFTLYLLSRLLISFFFFEWREGVYKSVSVDQLLCFVKLFALSIHSFSRGSCPLNDYVGIALASFVTCAPTSMRSLKQMRGPFLRSQFEKSINGAFNQGPTAGAQWMSSIERDVALSRFVLGTMPELQRYVNPNSVSWGRYCEWTSDAFLCMCIELLKRTITTYVQEVCSRILSMDDDTSLSWIFTPYCIWYAWC